jgi:hypothetical protein
MTKISVIPGQGNYFKFFFIPPKLSRAEPSKRYRKKPLFGRPFCSGILNLRQSEFRVHFGRGVEISFRGIEFLGKDLRKTGRFP